MNRTLVAAVLWIVPTSASATTIVALDDAALVKAADTIVVGSVIGTQTLVLKGGAIVTRANFQVYRVLRGAKVGDVLTLDVPGGRVGGMIADTSGSPKLQAGQMYLGFLESHAGVRVPLGLSYGLLKVRTDASGVRRVYRDTDGLYMLAPGGGPVDPKSVQIRDETLESVISRVEMLLGGTLGALAPTTPAHQTVTP